MTFCVLLAEAPANTEHKQQMAHMYGNWLGVLKWSLAQSDGTRPSEVKPMEEEVSPAAWAPRCHVFAILGP